MKKISKLLLLITIVISFLAIPAGKARANDPNNTYGTDNGVGNAGVNDGNGGNNKQTFLPINSGVVYLLIAGAVGGVFFLNRRRLSGKTK